MPIRRSQTLEYFAKRDQVVFFSKNHANSKRLSTWTFLMIFHGLTMMPKVKSEVIRTIVNYAISKLVQWSQDVEHKHGAFFINLDNEPISPRVNGHYLMPEGLYKAPLFSILLLSQTFPHLNFSQSISILSQIATLTTLNHLGLELLHGVLRYEILIKLQKC